MKQRSNKISSIRRNLSLKHKMERDFIMPINEWKEEYRGKYEGEDWRIYRYNHPYTKFISSEILIRSIDDTAYPEQDNSLPRGHYGHFKAEVFDFYHNGLIVYAYPYHQDITAKRVRHDEGGGFLFYNVGATVLGYIPYNNIIDYDIGGDEYNNYPHVFCDYANGTDPFEYIRYAIENDIGGYNILCDHEVAETSKTERVNKMSSFLADDDYEEYDYYCGTIICADCNKELKVNRNTDIAKGAWIGYSVTVETLEFGDEMAVCFDCYPNYCIKADTGDREQLQKLEKDIKDASKFKYDSKEMETITNCLNKLTDYSLREGKTVIKAKIAYHLRRLLEVKGTPNFDTAVAELVSWYKTKFE